MQQFCDGEQSQTPAYIHFIKTEHGVLPLQDLFIMELLMGTVTLSNVIHAESWSICNSFGRSPLSTT